MNMRDIRRLLTLLPQLSTYTNGGVNIMDSITNDMKKTVSAADTGGTENMFSDVTIAGRVLMPGSPNRIDMMTEQWDSCEFIKRLDREYRVASGVYKETPITAVSSGIGGPSFEIPFSHLLNRGVNTIIRVGSTGTLREDINLGDIIINDSSVRLDGMSRQYVREEFPAVASYEVTLALVEACENLGYTYHVGTGCTTASFYAGQARPAYGGYQRSDSNAFFGDMKNAGVLNFEMEGASLFTLSRIFGIRAGMCSAVIANRITGEWLKHSGEEKSCLVGAEAVRILSGWDALKAANRKGFFFPGLLKGTK